MLELINCSLAISLLIYTRQAHTASKQHRTHTHTHTYKYKRESDMTLARYLLVLPAIGLWGK